MAGYIGLAHNSVGDVALQESKSAGAGTCNWELKSSKLKYLRIAMNRTLIGYSKGGLGGALGRKGGLLSGCSRGCSSEFPCFSLESP